jgi:hypothetical protein
VAQVAGAAANKAANANGRGQAGAGPDPSNVRPWFDQARKDLKALNDEYEAGVTSDRRKALLDVAEQISRQAETQAKAAQDPKQGALLLVIAGGGRGALFNMKAGLTQGLSDGRASLERFKSAFALAADVPEVAIAYGMSQVPLLHRAVVKPSPDEVRASVRALAAFPENPAAQELRLKLASWEEAFDGQQVNAARACIETLRAKHDPTVDSALLGTENWLKKLETAKRR